MEKNDVVNKSKKTKWQRTRGFWIPFWCVFNPITFLAVVTCIGAADTPNHKDSRRISEENLAPLCAGNGYIYDNIEGSAIHMSYAEYHYKSDLENLNTFGYGEFDRFLLYTEDYYFFLSSTSGWNRDYFILKSNHFFSNIELVDAVGKNISNIHSGYGTHIYYESNDRYYDLNVINGNKKELDSSSLEASLIKNRVEYKAFVGVEFGDCKRKDSTLTFSYFNKTYSLGESLIDSTIYGYMKEAKFKPYYHLSYSTNISTIVYYGYPDPWGGWADCLLIDFDRESNKALKYQLFNFVDRGNFKLYPLIHLT